MVVELIHGRQGRSMQGLSSEGSSLADYQARSQAGFIDGVGLGPSGYLTSARGGVTTCTTEAARQRHAGRWSSGGRRRRAVRDAYEIRAVRQP
jgi:hypothetical protein